MPKDSKDANGITTTLLAVALMTIAPLWRAHAGHVTETIVAPVSITNQIGSYSGSINALATKDQIDTQKNSTKYVQFGTSPGSSYRGYLTYSLPPTVNPAQITTLTFIANVLGPSANSDAFTWSILNWNSSVASRMECKLWRLIHGVMQSILDRPIPLSMSCAETQISTFGTLFPLR